MRIAIIGGTGVYDPAFLENPEELIISTPFGEAKVLKGIYYGEEVGFLARHGVKHSVPPHKVNYKANMWALKNLGVERILTTTAVGSLKMNLVPGDIVILDQFIDFTKNRDYTYYNGDDGRVIHLDFTNPYCPELRNILFNAAKELGIRVHPYGTYVCTEGPRFETPAEIKMFATFGDVVGMTNVPEVILARELEMCYATVSLVTNYAAGISQNILTHQEVLEVMSENIEKVRKLFSFVIPKIPKERSCVCKDALKEYKEKS
ncbi:MAG TPA: S-methyl-5'-thioadenosine phosphorylase [Dictyoglomaceae bacterium]|nr:S-methyl-5'-thioadenosine phosphorylase [Dictyoglomaceae bacterium]HOL39538.1 S-methyl-5'-thioadenosine phosphorylase [Dictyoglomaceae bacterium]HPP16083.1 S-methyl-5'-thioadenosine phosphorylase [Dictyoglomaceae bacterium]HPU43018.1 S-methyl-5'-thioadenosine phosphorylase [Dictyoglomaceae bacterium]